MANESRGEVDIPLMGKTYTMRPTFQNMREIEHRTGKTIAELVENAQVKDFLASLDWQKMLEIGLGIFNLPPREFWEMTMYEYQALLTVHKRKMGNLGITQPPTRLELKEMMDKSPDK